MSRESGRVLWRRPVQGLSYRKYTQSASENGAWMDSHRVGVEAAVLLADVVGSTPLYESVGDAVAVGRIDDWRECMRALISGSGGEFVSSKGDDVLSIFEDPRAAFAAVSRMRVPA